MKTDDGSIIDSEGKLVFLSRTLFERDVAKGARCFLCAQSISKNTSTREHIIPNWVIRKCNIQDRRINLPNGARVNYGRYVIECCTNCNGLLDKEIEKPIKKVFDSGFDGLRDFINNGGRDTLIIWLSLIFIKTHLKDQNFRMNLNFKSGNESIAEGVGYDWDIFHHTYCISRIPFTKSSYDDSALGSLIVVKINEDGIEDHFDFFDITRAHTIGLVIQGVGIIAVFGDAGVVRHAIETQIVDRIEGPVSHPQFRELVAHFSSCALHLKTHPNFMTITSRSNHDELKIVTTMPERWPEFEVFERRLLGSLMTFMLHDFIDENELEDLASGELSFLFDGDGKFIKESYKPKE